MAGGHSTCAARRAPALYPHHTPRRAAACFLLFAALPPRFRACCCRAAPAVAGNPPLYALLVSEIKRRRRYYCARQVEQSACTPCHCARSHEANMLLLMEHYPAPGAAARSRIFTSPEGRKTGNAFSRPSLIQQRREHQISCKLLPLSMPIRFVRLAGETHFF